MSSCVDVLRRVNLA